MKIRKFYKKHMNFFELTRGYLGVIFLGLVGCYYNSGLPGMFGEQVNTILDACANGGCPI